MGFCYQKNFSNPTLPVDEAQFWALVRATQWNEAIDKFRETHDAALKRKLPAFIFQAMFDETESKKGKVGAWRKQSATRLTGLVVMDIDHVENPRETWAQIDNGQLTIDNELRKRILLVYITPSGHGLKIVFKADVKKGNLIDNQHAMAEVLGVEVDESCKDASRMSFICKESDILYLDKELFTYENKEFAERYTALYRDGHSQATNANVKTNTNLTNRTNKGEEDNSCNSSSELKWRGYDVQSIIDQRYADKLPCADDSNRHNSSLELSSDLLLMLEGDKKKVLEIVERQPWVKEIINDRNENVEQTVESAEAFNKKKEKETLHPYPSKKMQEAIKQVTGKTFQELVYPKLAMAVDRQTQMEHRLMEWGYKIGELMDDYPMLKDVCDGLPVMQRPAAVFLAGGLMMTLMTRCWYRFYHKPEKKRRLNCSLLVIGDPASGKSVATDLYELLAEPIVVADKAGKKAVNTWKETTEAQGANKDKQVKPHAMIRIHPARTSNQTFITDMVNTVEVIDGEEVQLHMLTFDSELDNTLTMQGGGSWINKLAMELKAFHNEEDGQAYSNKGSVQQDFNVTWNYIYTGTPLAMKSKVNDKNFGTGLPTRLTVIPMPATNFKMMDLQDFEHFDYERHSRMRQWAYALDKTKGELTLWPLVKKLWEWTARRMEDAEEDDSKAEEMLCKRCAYHGLNYSAPYIVMRHWDQMHQDGKYWCGKFEVDDKDWQLCELLTNIHHACQIHYFLGMAEKYFDNQLVDSVSSTTHRLKTVEGFNRLPEEFTTEDVMRCFNLKDMACAGVKVNRLVKDNLVAKVADYKENGTIKAKYRKIGTITH